MKSDDKISVLICVHSQDEFHDKLLTEALDSLRQQKYQNFDTHIVCDECWMPTIELATAWQELMNPKVWKETDYPGRVFVHQKAKKEGLAKAKNFGLQHCTGDWIAFLDADDFYAPCKLNIQRDFLMVNPHIDVCGTLAWDLDRTKDYYKPSCFRAGQYETHAQIEARLRSENIMCHGSMMIRRSALDHVGGYVTDKAMLGREDWATWVKLLDAGFTFHNIPERLYYWSCNTSVER